MSYPYVGAERVMQTAAITPQSDVAARKKTMVPQGQRRRHCSAQQREYRREVCSTGQYASRSGASHVRPPVPSLGSSAHLDPASCGTHRRRRPSRPDSALVRPIAPLSQHHSSDRPPPVAEATPGNGSPTNNPVVRSTRPFRRPDLRSLSSPRTAAVSMPVGHRRRRREACWTAASTAASSQQTDAKCPKPASFIRGSSPPPTSGARMMGRRWSSGVGRDVGAAVHRAPAASTNYEAGGKRLPVPGESACPHPVPGKIG